MSRAARDNAATLLVLYPLMVGTGLLLLGRVLADLGPPPASLTWGVWALFAVFAAFLARRASAVEGVDAVACLPVGRAARSLDAYLAALVRVLPAGVLAGVVAVRGAQGWPALGGLLAIVAAVPLVAVPGARRPARGPRRWHLAANVVTILALPVPRPWRHWVARDLVTLVRGGVRGTAVNGLLALLCTGWACQTAWAGGARNEGLLAVSLSAWALSSCVSPLLACQWRTLWTARDAGTPPGDLWLGKVAVATLLGVLPALPAGVAWLPVSVQVALLCPALGGAVGLVAGAAVMEGDGRPLLHGILTLLFALGTGVLAILGAPWLVAAPLLAAYLQKLGVPRLARRMRERVPDV